VIARRNARTKLFENTVSILVKNGYDITEAERLVQERRDGDRAADLVEARRVDDILNDLSDKRSTQLITLATVLLTVVGLFIAQNDIFSALNDRQKWTILIAFILIFASISSGVIQSMHDEKFWKKWQNAWHRRRHEIESLIQNNKIVSFEEKAEKEKAYMENLEPESSSNFSNAQILFLLLGFLCFILILASIMFDFPGVR
jgi:hypothetical protein